MAKRTESAGKKIISLVITAILVILAVMFKDEIKFDDTITLDEGNIGVYFVDVGQGNCTVIQSGDEGVLIDTGEREYAQTVLSFLEKRGIKSIKTVIATHPHSDHIGSMATVVTKTSPENVYMPYIKDEFVPTTNTYLNFITAVDETNANAHFVKNITQLDFNGVKISIVPPAVQTDDMNNMSLIVKIAYGKISFLIPGDAEKKEMKAILSKYKDFDFNADFYLMAHHGSSTSVYETFLDSVNFTAAIISCAEGNEYGHPHKEALDYLDKYSIRYYRTDEQGTISVITDAESCNITTEKE